MQPPWRFRFMKWSGPAMTFPRRELPSFARLRQRLPSDHISDVRGDVRQKVAGSGFLRRIERGNRIAITAGSRGIGGFVELLSGIVDAVKPCGGEPFIIPAMGSHGGATAGGQTEILRRLGVNEQTVGAPIRATMETRELGTADNGAVAHVDRFAAEADGIIVLGRTKTHPESVGELASGLLKMCTIGLGKQTGAHQAHSHGFGIRCAPCRSCNWPRRKSCAASPWSKTDTGSRAPSKSCRRPTTLFSKPTCACCGSPKQHLARIPFDELDLLIVDELGQDDLRRRDGSEHHRLVAEFGCAASARITGASSCCR